MIRQLTEHFKLTEIMCPCCQRIRIVPELAPHMDKLEELRIMAGFPITVNSGYRCSKHNIKVRGGKDGGWHPRIATDIRPLDRDPGKVLVIYRIALTLDFGGIGKHPTFIHLDPRATLWRQKYNS